MKLDELQSHLTGLMSFPVTPFDAAGELDLPRFREHFREQLASEASALFVACGTGELFSLGPDEHQDVVRAAVQEAAGAKPVVAGVGYGWGLASEMAQAAQRAGADAVLVLPPYLVQAEQEGLYAHYRRIAEAVSIGIIPYQRANGVLAPETVARLSTLPNLVALKDGHGDVDLLTRVRLATDGQLPLMNGMPTAELSSYAFRACGVGSYSSAVLNFVPELATAYYRAFVARDAETTDRLLRGFFKPLVELRDKRPGYAVALIKAGVNARRASVGAVRPPLLPPTEEHQERLEKIIADGLGLL